MAKYRDPLKIPPNYRKVGLAGVAKARQALDEAKKRAPVNYSEWVKREGENADDVRGYSNR